MQTGMDKLKQMADEGKPAAMFHLGNFTLDGAMGIDKDEESGVKLLENAMEMDASNHFIKGVAARYLGIHFAKNDDYGPKALLYFEKAVKFGDSASYIDLGLCQMKLGQLEKGLFSIRKSLQCGLQDDEKILEQLMQFYKQGLVTKDEYGYTLRAHQEAVKQSYSKGRQDCKNFRKNVIHSNEPPPFPTREMTEEEMHRLFGHGAS